jgi:hypothetical protein
MGASKHTEKEMSVVVGEEVGPARPSPDIPGVEIILYKRG